MSFFLGIKNKPSENSECLVSISKEEKTVRGESLAPLVKDGEGVLLLKDYYKCYPIERNDFIAYKYGGNADPLMKVARGLPEDKFNLATSSDKTGWNILINEKILTNGSGVPYNIGENGRRMLSLYVKDYKGQIPKDAYLILGEDPGGSLDSTRFGLVGRSDILGKVVKE